MQAENQAVEKMAEQDFLICMTMLTQDERRDVMQALIANQVQRAAREAVPA